MPVGVQVNGVLCFFLMNPDFVCKMIRSEGSQESAIIPVTFMKETSFLDPLYVLGHIPVRMLALCPTGHLLFKATQKPHP
ncbi:hypothetical protein TNIN_442881 [Trichonephila inaurata madagascariensis]|uniref:Uncharacterized protein n=1 Tax=Trichonephila inaurata madagascariensis TaxID=2747483 RepID=A0A8X6KME0_9ARAC|nr:hypothetical protein TNIN_442881 [Trichonephila inaurata madagascariensis]